MIRAEETDDGLRLLPPFFVGIEVAVGRTLIVHATVRRVVALLEDGRSDAKGGVPRSLAERAPTHRAGRLDEKPAGLDVVPEGYHRRPRLPIRREEAADVCPGGTDDGVLKERDERLETGSHMRVRPHRVKRGVRLEQMKMHVHALPLIRVLFAQTYVAEQGPLAGERLLVAAVLAIVRMCLDEAEERDGRLEAACVAGRAKVLGERIDGEALRVHMLAGLNGLSAGIQHPEHAAMHRVDEMAREVRRGSIRHLAIAGIAELAIRRREGPQEARMQDGALRRVLMPLTISCDQAHHATVALVGSLLHPKSEDPARQLFFHLRAEGTQRRFSRHAPLARRDRDCVE